MRKAIVVALMLAAGCDTQTPEPSEPAPQRPRTPPPTIPLIDRIKIEGPRSIGNGEDLRIIRIPNALMPTLPSMDNVCLLYRDANTEVAALHCFDDSPE